MYAGVSGLRTHQTMMDVVGNNIANVNTAGFKGSSTVFQDVLSQTLQGASAPVAGTAGAAGTPAAGGTNPAQVGLGVRMGGISTNTGQGASQLTGRATDLAVQGDGYFVVSQGGQTLYTRAGSFGLDASGQLVTPAGGLVQRVPGTPVATTPPGPTPPTNGGIQIPMDGSIQSFSIGPNGTVTGIDVDGNTVQFGTIALATFPNPGGLEKVGGSLLRASTNSGAVIGLAAGATGGGSPGVDGRGTLAVGVLEMSNVDLAQEFTNMIVAQRGFQANSRIITTSDELLQELVNLKR
jgi:flagellar hook protein FlgE